MATSLPEGSSESPAGSPTPGGSPSPTGSPEGAVQHLRVMAGLFESFLEERILEIIRARAVPQMAEPVIYSLTAGGKRIRPALCMLCAGLPSNPSVPEADLPADGPYQQRVLYQERVLYAAAALEAIHTYSLIHDDLPAMDDDSMRRGRPSNHVEFGDWAAILAGDALNTLAFELMIRTAPPGESPGRALELLAEGAGLGGMICGQALDLYAEKVRGDLGNQDTNRTLLEEIHHKKTGALLRASCEIGAVIAGVVDTAGYRDYGLKLGLLFQISDDLLDETGDADALGKTAGKDRESGKLTYPALYGLEESRRKARDLSEDLIALAETLEPGPHGPADHRNVLRALPALIRDRDR